MTWVVSFYEMLNLENKWFNIHILFPLFYTLDLKDIWLFIIRVFARSIFCWISSFINIMTERCCVLLCYKRFWIQILSSLLLIFVLPFLCPAITPIPFDWKPAASQKFLPNSTLLFHLPHPPISTLLQTSTLYLIFISSIFLVWLFNLCVCVFFLLNYPQINPFALAPRQ